MPIDVNFTNPDTPPSSSDAANFRIRADQFVGWISGFVTKLMTFISQLNSTEASINAKEASAVAASAAAVAAANYKGIFIQGISSALVGESWSYNGGSYRCAVNTSINPVDEPASWVSTSVDAVIHAAPSENPGDTDEFGYWDSFTQTLRKVTLGSLKTIFAALDSPVFTGTPTAPTPTVGDNSAQVATTAFVNGANNTVTTTTIGTVGEIGFGVGVAPTALVTSMGLVPMVGHNILGHDNYGNYMDLSGSVMVFVPKFYYKITNDVASPFLGTKVEISDTAQTGFVIHRAFVNNGAIQDGFFFDKYPCGNVGGKFVSARHIRAVSTNSVNNPIASITGVTLGNRYDAIFQAVKSRGAGYAVPTMFMYNALALLSLAHAQSATPATAAWMDVAPFAPKGCNNNALRDANDSNVLYVSAGYDNQPLTGSVEDANFAKITHNGQNCGIADLNGNMWDIASGFIQLTADAFRCLKETIDIKTLTGVNAADATDNWNAANYDTITLPFTPNEVQTTMGNGTSAVFSGSTDTASNDYRLDACGVPRSMGGAPARFGGDGFWNWSTASMCPIVGGTWSGASLSGVWARDWVHARSSSSSAVGGRACLIGA